MVKRGPARLSIAPALVALLLAVGCGDDEAPADKVPTGELDPDFGSGGLETTDIGDVEALYALATGPDGELVAAGESFDSATFDSSFAVARYSADGTPDTSFSKDGHMTIASDQIGLEVIDSGTAGVAVQPDGKIVFAGTAAKGGNWRFAVVRLNPDGQLDDSFGDGGVVTTDVGPVASEEGSRSVLLQEDGGIVVAGAAAEQSNGGGEQFTLIRYQPDGSLDPTFGDGGIALAPPLTEGGDEPTAAALDDEGKILFVGSVTAVSGPVDESGGFIVARFLSDGSLDTSFAEEGFTTTLFEDPHFEPATSAVAAAPDGGIVAAGSVDRFVQGGLSDRTDMAVARYESNGTLDASFAEDGRAVVPFGDSGARALAVDPDGRIYLAGSAKDETRFALARLDEAGAPDESFADGGTVETRFPGGQGTQFANAVVLGDEIVVAGGTVSTSLQALHSSEDFALAGYGGD